MTVPKLVERTTTAPLGAPEKKGYAKIDSLYASLLAQQQLDNALGSQVNRMCQKAYDTQQAKELKHQTKLDDATAAIAAQQGLIEHNTKAKQISTIQKGSHVAQGSEWQATMSNLDHLFAKADGAHGNFQTELDQASNVVAEVLADMKSIQSKATDGAHNSRFLSLLQLGSETTEVEDIENATTPYPTTEFTTELTTSPATTEGLTEEQTTKALVTNAANMLVTKLAEAGKSLQNAVEQGLNFNSTESPTTETSSAAVEVDSNPETTTSAATTPVATTSPGTLEPDNDETTLPATTDDEELFTTNSPMQSTTVATNENAGQTTIQEASSQQPENQDQSRQMGKQLEAAVNRPQRAAAQPPSSQQTPEVATPQQSPATTPQTAAISTTQQGQTGPKTLGTTVAPASSPKSSGAPLPAAKKVIKLPAETIQERIDAAKTTSTKRHQVTIAKHTAIYTLVGSKVHRHKDLADKLSQLLSELDEGTDVAAKKVGQLQEVVKTQTAQVALAHNISEHIAHMCKDHANSFEQRKKERAAVINATNDARLWYNKTISEALHAISGSTSPKDSDGDNVVSIGTKVNRNIARKRNLRGTQQTLRSGSFDASHAAGPSNGPLVRMDISDSAAGRAGSEFYKPTYSDYKIVATNYDQEIPPEERRAETERIRTDQKTNAELDAKAAAKAKAKAASKTTSAPARTTTSQTTNFLGGLSNLISGTTTKKAGPTTRKSSTTTATTVSPSNGADSIDSSKGDAPKSVVKDAAGKSIACNCENYYSGIVPSKCCPADGDGQRFKQLGGRPHETANEAERAAVAHDLHQAYDTEVQKQKIKILQENERTAGAATRTGFKSTV